MKRLASLLFVGFVALAGCGDDSDSKSDASHDASSDSSGDAGSDAAAAATCDSYCTANIAACTGDNAQYADKAACVSYCNDASGWAQGTAGATSGNTLECRVYHTGVAGMSAMNATDHCDHTGTSGGDVCGSWCDNFCTLAQKNCTGGNMIYADMAACMTACNGVPTDGVTGATSGNNIQCRIYHAGAPAAADPATHCPHAAGTAVCVAP